MNQKNRFIIAIILNSLIVVIEIISGLISGSVSLITDAFHNFGDVLALIISLIALLYREKKATLKMTYGYIRSEMMGGFVHSFFLILSMLFIFTESIQRIIKPSTVNSIYMIVIASIAFLINAISAFLIKDKPHLHKDKEAHEDLNIKASFVHLLGDALFSLGVVSGGILMLIFNIQYIDPILSIIFSIIIIAESIDILKKTFLSLMDAAPEQLNKITNQILSHSEIKSIHDIHIIKPSSKDIHFSAHIVLKKALSLEKIENLLEVLRCELASFGITHILFQPETEKYHNSEYLCQSHN